MPVDFLSDEQAARYGRFEVEPSPGELAMFFRLDERTLTHARSKRAPANRLGFTVQWGAVRMLGAFVTENLSAVPEVVVRAGEGKATGPVSPTAAEHEVGDKPPERRTTPLRFSAPAARSKACTRSSAAPSCSRQPHGRRCGCLVYSLPFVADRAYQDCGRAHTRAVQGT